MAGRQRASLLVPSSASIHLTNLLENITQWERAAIVQPSDKWTPAGVTHQYRKYKEPLMHSLHLLCHIVHVIFLLLSFCVVAACVMSWQSSEISCLACKSSTSLFLYPPQWDPTWGRTHTSASHTHTHTVWQLHLISHNSRRNSLSSLTIVFRWPSVGGEFSDPLSSQPTLYYSQRQALGLRREYPECQAKHTKHNPLTKII